VTPLGTVLLSGGALGVAAPLALGRLRRLEHAPQPAAYLWLATTAGALVALVLAGFLLVLPSGDLAMDLAVVLRTCSMALRQALDASSGAPGPLLGLALLALVPGGLLTGAVVAGARAWRAARCQRELLVMAGQRHPDLPGVTVLDHPTPLAYCLPGRPGPVVLTTAALHRLDPGQLAAVLAHERAHQARRHHRLLLAAEVLRTGFPWLPAARAGRAAVGRLVELAADDDAVHRHGRAETVAALAKLATAPTPAVGLGAGGPSAPERIRRLTAPPPTGGARTLLLATLVIAVPLVAELAAVTAPLLSVAGTPICPLG
jgi:Zn-dependent protease with chaperone function